RQVGRAPFAAAGVHVEGVEGVPVPRFQVGAAQLADDQALAPYRVAFLADRLALARGECAEEIVEGFVAGVAPMVLAAEPLQPAVRAEALPFRFVAEG